MLNSIKSEVFSTATDSAKAINDRLSTKNIEYRYL